MSRASSEPLTSPSPSPPPIGPSKKPASTAKAAGLDSSSELSDLTEDEQDGSGDSGQSSTPQSSSKRNGRKKRGGIVPAPMWDWAYKNSSKKPADGEENAVMAAQGAHDIPDGSARIDQRNSANNKDADDEDDEDNELSKDKTATGLPGSDGVDESGERPADRESEDEEKEEDEEDDTIAAPTISHKKSDTREASLELTPVEDAEDALSQSEQSDSGFESEATADSDDEESEPEEEEPVNDRDKSDAEGDEEEAPATNADTAPVVATVFAGSSIMAGQQLIKTPSASPSTSPEPEEERVAANAADVDPETGADLDAEPEADVDNDGDLAERPGHADFDADADADVEAEAEVEAEEAELELQPQHRAEALDVLAQIELKYALLREALYVEKMEDLAIEEAMVLQNVHPEMIHLQNELQVRHDRRLELAAKKRQREDDHVSLVRKVEEESVWSWWKFERDDLQVEMYSEANRKRRKLEREKRVLDRAPPARRIPQPQVTRTPSKPLSVRDLIKYASSDANQPRSNLKRKRKEPVGHGRVYPALSVLAPQEIQNDLQVLMASRSRPYYGQAMGEIGPGMGMAPPHEHYMDYGAPGMGAVPPSHVPFGHGLPQGPPQPNMHHSYAPQPPPGRTLYHHQQPAPAPMGSIHHPNARPMQGPGQPHVQTGPGAPPPMGGYLGQSVRQMRRTPSPPPMAGFEHGGMVNGGGQYAGTSGPGQHWMPVPTSTASSSSAGKQPMVNGWGKEHRRMANGVKDGPGYDGRERDVKQEREIVKERDRAGLWHENGIKEMDERMHGQHAPPLQQSQHPHRHTSVHQSLQHVPHHHHVVHHRHNSHHHHHAPRPNAGGQSHLPVPRQHDIDRHMGSEHDHAARRPGPTIEQINLVSKPVSSSPYWKTEDPDPPRERERGRAPLLAPAPPAMGQLGPLPDRPQTTPFVMTPSQAIQVFPPQRGGSPPRRERWTDENPHVRSRYEPDNHGQPIPGGAPPVDGGARRNHSHHLASPTRQGSHGIASPRPRSALPNSPPTSTFPNHLHSPSRIPLASTHASPHASSSTPKGLRPISPLPGKLASSLSYASGPPSGPGTPGSVGHRLGTPGLAGPGTRPDGPINGHPHFPSALAGPAQPLIPPSVQDTPVHLVPPKMNAVQLGNGA